MIAENQTFTANPENAGPEPAAPPGEPVSRDGSKAIISPTTELGIQLVLYVALQEGDGPVVLRNIAAHLGCSRGHAARVCAGLVEKGILRAHRGALGGFTLAVPSSEITLLDIVEACQGRMLDAFFAEFTNPTEACDYHRALQEWFEATVRILSSRTVDDLMPRPWRPPCTAFGVPCGVENVIRLNTTV